MAQQDEPQVWHYGLMAERWGEFLHDTPELPFLRQQIERHGQPVLDLCCGAGRLLVPLKAAGIDVDGCDISVDMLEQARRRLATHGLETSLSAQPIDSLRMPRRYRTIYIASSFGLGGSREHDLEGLRRCHEHLEPGGALIVDIDAEYTDADGWNRWLPAYRRGLPEPWPTDVQPRVAADGTEHVGLFRTVDIDPLEQTYTREVRLEKRRDGELIAQEQYTLRGGAYLKPEMLLMLQVAGFRDIELRGDYRDEPATPDSDKIVFVARA
jgi:SAM-dependent methyltransferase